MVEEKEWPLRDATGSDGQVNGQILAVVPTFQSAGNFVPLSEMFASGR